MTEPTPQSDPHTAPGAKPRETVLSVRNLTTRFRTDSGILTAIEDVSFDLAKGETLGIVGESGCGKSVTSKSIMRLLPASVSLIDPKSQILFQGKNLATANASTMRTIRGDKIAMIFQEPMTSLNPVFRIGWQIDEALKYHTTLNKKERRDKCINMLRLVDIPNPEKRVDEYPHQLSGGMRQRVMIAIALCCEPDILIADEPTTALDVTIQAQILDLMNKLREELETAIMLITHDLGVVATVCDRVVVMYAGRVIEQGPVHDIFHSPLHPYTKALLESIPRRGNKVKGARLPTISGVVPSLANMPAGCRFEARCRYAFDRCVSQEPQLERIGNRNVRCHAPLGTDRERPVNVTVGATSGAGEIASTL